MVSQTHHAALPVLLCAPSLTLQVVPGASLSSGFYLALASERRRRETFERDETASLPCPSHTLPPAPGGPGSYGEAPFWGSSSDAAQQACSPPALAPGGLNIPVSDHGSVCSPLHFFFFKVKPLLMCSLCPAKTLIHSGSHAGHPRSTSPTKAANVNERTPRKT